MTFGPEMLMAVLVLAGAVGLVVGSFLNVVIVRVPTGISLTRESRCPRCDAPVRPWQNVPVLSWIALRGRCASCGERISLRYPLVEVATSAAFTAVVWHFVLSGETGAVLVIVIVAYLYLAAISIALAVIDLETHRLPNLIVLPSYAVGGILFTLAALVGGDGGALLRAGVGTAALYSFYLLLRVIRPDGMGGGDVKLAGALGGFLGWLGWGSIAVGAFAAFLLGGMFGIILIALRRAGRASAIPFGPWMLAGAWVGVFWGETLAGWYLDLFAA